MGRYILLAVYVCYLIVFSLLAFVVYGKDKKMAEDHGGPKRIKEKTLLELTIFGGAIGAFVARKKFHHKTDKGYFTFTILTSLVCQLAVLVAFVLLAFVF